MSESCWQGRSSRSEIGNRKSEVEGPESLFSRPLYFLDIYNRFPTMTATHVTRMTSAAPANDMIERAWRE